MSRYPAGADAHIGSLGLLGTSAPNLAKAGGTHPCCIPGESRRSAGESNVRASPYRVRRTLILLGAVALAALVASNRSYSASGVALSASLQPDAGQPPAVGESGKLLVSVSPASCCITNLILRFSGLSTWSRIGTREIRGADLGRNYCDEDAPATRVRSPHGEPGLWIDFGTVDANDCDTFLLLTLTKAGTQTVTITAYSGVWRNGAIRVQYPLPGGSTKWSMVIHP